MKRIEIIIKDGKGNNKSISVDVDFNPHSVEIISIQSEEKKKIAIMEKGEVLGYTEIIRETEKAFLVNHPEFDLWIPKSKVYNYIIQSDDLNYFAGKTREKNEKS